MNKNDIQLGKDEVGRMPPHSLGERVAGWVRGGWVLPAHVCMRGCGCTSHSHLHAREGGGGPVVVPARVGGAGGGVGGADEATSPPTRVCMRREVVVGWWCCQLALEASVVVLVVPMRPRHLPLMFACDGRWWWASGGASLRWRHGWSCEAVMLVPCHLPLAFACDGRWWWL